MTATCCSPWAPWASQAMDEESESALSLLGSGSWALASSGSSDCGSGFRSDDLSQAGSNDGEVGLDIVMGRSRACSPGPGSPYSCTPLSMHSPSSDFAPPSLCQPQTQHSSRSSLDLMLPDPQQSQSSPLLGSDYESDSRDDDVDSAMPPVQDLTVSDNTASPAGGLTPPVVTELVDAFRWPHLVFSRLKNFVGSELEASMLRSVKPLALSSHFSGIGTAEVAGELLRAAFPWDQPAWHTVSLCESDRACRAILSRRFSISCCILTDVLDYCDKQQMSGFLKSESVDFENICCIAKETLHHRPQPCGSHQQSCAPPRIVHGDISGSPCTPWSKAGQRRGKTDPRVCLLASWIAWARSTLPMFLIHENVAGFDTRVLEERLGKWYDIVHLRMQPSDLGFVCVGRPRLYSILLRRGHVRVLADLRGAYDQVRQAFSGSRLVLEQLWDIARPSDLCREENRLRKKRALSSIEEHTQDWTYLLTPKQQGYLEVYMDLWLSQKGTLPLEDPMCVFNLSQDPSHRVSWTLSGGALPTCTTGSLLWMPKRRRWLLPVEVAAAFGFPVRAQLAKAAQVPVDPCADEYVMRMLGNGMHVANVGTALALTLACCAMVPGKIMA